MLIDSNRIDRQNEYNPPMSSPAPPLDRAIVRRLTATLFASSAINRTAFIAAITITAIAAEDMLGSARFAGLPGAIATIGVAMGASFTSTLMAGRGRRYGFVVGLSIGVLGGMLATIAAIMRAFWLLLIALYLFGVGSGADRLGRYAAADAAGPSRAARAIATIVWAGTIGSIAGPALLEPAERLARVFDLPMAAGAYAFATVLVTMATFLIWLKLRPDPVTFAIGDKRRPTDQTVRRATRRHFRQPRTMYALVALAVGQIVMALIMAMTPIHIRAAGQSIGVVGIVISAHTLGMFALSPLSGWLAHRIGNIRVIVIGQLLLIVAALVAMPAGGGDRGILIVALFLLGLGWNLGFVAGSALLTESIDGPARIRVQGIADTIAWTSGAAAVFASGFLLEWGGYARLNVIGAALVVGALAYRTRLDANPKVSTIR